MRKQFEEKTLGEAFQGVDVVLQRGVIQSSIDTFYPPLQGCIIKKDLVAGRELHNLITINGFEESAFLGSHLVRMYASCGSFLEAKRVFKRLPEKNVFTWGITILAHAKLGQAKQAIELYHQMKRSKVELNQYVYVAVIKACACSEFLTEGMLIHAHIIEDGFTADVFVGSTLIDMYAKCGSLFEAHRVLEALPIRNVVTWNTMLAGCAQHGCGHEALRVFYKMVHNGMKPDSVTYVNILKACSSVTALQVRKLLHAQVVEDGFDDDVFVGSTLIDMYCRCESYVEDARRVFHTLPSRTIVSWNAMMAGLVQNGGHAEEVFHLFQQLKLSGIQPDSDTYTSVLKACSNTPVLDHGKLIHAVIYGSRSGSDPFVGTALIDMYFKCASLKDACRVFEKLSVRTVVIWNALMSGYVQHGASHQALDLFLRMQQEGVEPDRVTFLNMLKACSISSALSMGKLLHTLIVQHGSHTDVFVGSALIDMYCKCGSLDYARGVFEVLPTRNPVTWNTMIAGYAQHGDAGGAYRVFQKMYEHDGIEPDNVTFASILKACLGIAFLDQGKLIHFLTADSGWDLDMVLSHCLIDMYAKCGSLMDACRVFDSLPKKDIIAWNTMITGYSEHDDYGMALKCFHNMQHGGLKPDHVTFCGLLSACSRAVLVKEACHHVKSMREDYGITPSIAHLYCMADLVARAGCLNEAEVLLQSIPIAESHNIGWLSLLTHSRTHGGLELGRRCFNHATMMDCGDASAYVLMEKLYLDASMLVDTSESDESRGCAGARKKPGKAVTMPEGTRLGPSRPPLSISCQSRVY